jgi:hypothetical protein
MFISIHIPKTAGTSLGYVLDHGLSRRVLWDYSDDYSTANAIQPDLAANIPFVRSWFRAIHGHFFYTKWADTFPDARVITCLRHPVERIISQYKHDLADALAGASSWLLDPMARGEVDVVDYVRMSPAIGRAQAAHLSGRDIEDYDFVFLTEDLQRGLAAFCRRFDFRRGDPFGNQVPFINSAEVREQQQPAASTSFRRLAGVTDEQRRKLFDLIPEEVELYRRGTEQYARTVATVLV